MPAKCQVEQQFYGVIKRERSNLIFTALLTYRPALFNSAQIRDKKKEEKSDERDFVEGDLGLTSIFKGKVENSGSRLNFLMLSLSRYEIELR